jgi:RNAse (barnase) inhibitor barstar
MDWIDLSKEIPWLGRDIFSLVNQSAEKTLTAELSKLGFKILVLDGERITNYEEFFSEIAPALGFPDYFGRNWNAFNDSFGDITCDPEKRLAIVWKQASVCLKANLHDFLGIVHRLLNAAFGARFGDAENEGIQVEVFLLGEAPEFNKKP